MAAAAGYAANQTVSVHLCMSKNTLHTFSRKLLYLLLPCVLFLWTGCFEILEDITIKANGTGTFYYTVNMSQSKAKLKSVMALDSVDGYRIPKRPDIEKDLEKAKKTLQGVKGISNVQLTSNFDDFIFSLKYDFTSVATLNESLQVLAQAFSNEKQRIPGADNNFSLTAKLFERKSNYNAKKESEKLRAKDAEILSKATYTSVYHFEKTITKCSNKDAKLSPNKKNVMVKVNLLQLVKGEKQIANRIELN